jgi:thiol:disulfide interchange protein
VPKSWTDEGFVPIPTVVKATATNATIGTLAWPEVHEIEADLTGMGIVEKYGVFEGRAIVRVPVTAKQDATGEVVVTMLIDYQACNDSGCLRPVDGHKEVITLKVEGEPVKGGAGSEESGGGGPKENNKLAFNVFGLEFAVGTTGVGYVLLLGLAFVGGLILNFTPCVLPIIPLKVLGLVQAAGNPRRALFLGTVMAAGVFAFWFGLGLVIALSTSIKGASQLSGVWWFMVAIGVFILTMGLGSLGAFNVGLPDWVYSINPSQDKPHGAFMYGIMSALLATPCVAPLMGTAAGWAAFQPALTTITVFGVIGLGMASIYIVLAANPAWVSKLPRGGPAGDALKQVLGLLMVGVSIFFVANGLMTLTSQKPYLSGVLYWWIIAAVNGVAAVWMIVRTFAITKSPVKRGIFTVIAVLLGGAMFAWANTVTQEARKAAELDANTDANGGGGGAKVKSLGHWKAWTQEAEDAARKEGKVVVLEFTASWCLICHTLESKVLNKPETVAALTGPGVVAFKVDLSASTSPGWDKLYQYKRNGPPLLVVSRPNSKGSENDWLSDAYTIDGVVKAIGEAVGAR